jgi:hypothetical protein
MTLPRLTPHESEKSAERAAAARTDCVLLAVYAPFGTDETLSNYPNSQPQPLTQHPLVRNLQKVAKLGVHVSALIDRVGEDTHLVEIPAGAPGRMCITSAWKEDMSSPLTLAGFLRRAHANHPSAALVLALEGHGAGFLPDIDRTKMTAKNITDDGRIEWKVSSSNSPALPEVSPMLPEVSPMLPEVSPMLPANHMPMSTWGLADALRRAQSAGVPKVAVLHLNNCFNMSVELLHTVAPYAHVATGYINYNFFTAGDTYPWVFGKLAQPGGLTALALAQTFADGNDKFLAAKGNHPTVGGVVVLSKMQGISQAIDKLARALLDAMRNAGAQRTAVILKIKKAIKDARQVDTPNGGGFDLDVPDEMTDIRSLALVLKDRDADFSPVPVAQAAQALVDALKGIWRYGAHDEPWIDTNVDWDFSNDDMAMNILLPDPELKGLWDWRSPFYMDNKPDPNAPKVQPHIIDFLQTTKWVEFIDEYHRDVKFVGLLSAKIPEFPVFNAKFVPPEKPPCDPDKPPTYGKPDLPKGRKGA